MTSQYVTKFSYKTSQTPPRLRKKRLKLKSISEETVNVWSVVLCVAEMHAPMSTAMQP